MTNFCKIKSYALHPTGFKDNFHNVPDGLSFKAADSIGVTVLTVVVDSSVVVDVVLVVVVVVAAVVVVGGSVGSPL